MGGSQIGRSYLRVCTKHQQVFSAALSCLYVKGNSFEINVWGCSSHPGVEKDRFGAPQGRWYGEGGWRRAKNGAQAGLWPCRGGGGGEGRVENPGDGV